MRSRLPFPELLVGLLLTALPAAGWAAVLHVPAQYPTIGQAITAAADRDSIYIDPGTYFGNLNTGTKELAFIGTASPSSTIIDGRNLARVFFLGRAGQLRSLTIQHGFDRDAGGGVVATGAYVADNRPLVIDNCVFRENSTGRVDEGYGGGLGIGIYPTSVRVANTQFINNRSAYVGGALWVSNDDALIEGCTFQGNRAGHSGGAMYMEGGRVRHCLVVDNAAPNTGGGLSGGTAELTGNTFARNTVYSSLAFGGAIDLEFGIGEVSNNVVWGTTGTGIRCNSQSSTPLRFRCNDSWGNSGPNYYMIAQFDTTGGGNLSLDPQFCAAAADNFHLFNTSPCLGTRGSCGLIGAFGLGCSQVPVVPITWSGLKTLLR